MWEEWEMWGVTGPVSTRRRCGVGERTLPMNCDSSDCPFDRFRSSESSEIE